MQAITIITVAQAEERARKRISEHYLAYSPNLAPPSRQPLQLPNGWRFPYDLYINTFRVRQAILIIFVDRNGNVEIERDDTSQISSLMLQFRQSGGREGISSTLAPNTQTTQPGPSYAASKGLSYQLPPLKSTLDTIYNSLNGEQVETIEPVWSKDEMGWGVYWRIGLVHNLRRSVVLVDGQRAPIGAPQSHPFQRSVAQSWKLGLASFKDNRLTVRLNNLPTAQAYLRNQWTVWSCMAYVGQFLTGLEYNNIGPQNVDIEFSTLDTKVEGAGFDVVRGVPTIGFQEDGDWADDLTIIMHELGHAIWYLLFTRPPQMIDVRRYANELKGIEEGFADYTAATLLYEGAPIEIGGKVAPVELSRYHLPRVISADPFLLPEDADLEHQDPHDIGHKWANLLWDFRTRLIAADPIVGQRSADLAIFNAHLKPPTMTQDLTQPLACYFQSLFLTAGDLLQGDAWQDLANRHQVVFTSSSTHPIPTTESGNQQRSV